MGRINLYVNEADEPLLERLRIKLEKGGRSMSEFVAEAAKDYLDSEAKPGVIELEGFGIMKVFHGNELYREEDRDSQVGVYLTAKKAIAYWCFTPAAVDQDSAVVFEVYDDLEELFEKQDWLDERRNRHIKTAIQQEYAALTKQRVVEELDI